jgi:hypothetical protein
MNKENMEFLLDSLKYLGFGEKLYLHQQLEEFVTKEAKDFQLETSAFFDEETVLEVRLHFRRSDQMDMYFFNKYEANLHHPDEPAKDRKQLFYINKGSGVTLKEAYNLLQGRAVNKDLTNVEGTKYNAWIQLNFDEKDQHDHYKVRQYSVQYGYDLEKTLEKYPILELKNYELRHGLLKSLKRGNLHTVTFEKLNKTEKMVIEANPRYKTINIYSLANRAAAKTPLQQDHRSAGVSGPKAGDGNGPGGAEEESGRDETGEIKEEELESSAGKPPSKKKISGKV